MIPRGILDIGWRDLVWGTLGCFVHGDGPSLQARLETLWSSSGNGLACLSVRSGFDLLLSELAFPAGSEILISAVTIPDMLRIIEDHGLIAIPLEVDPWTLAIDPAALRERSSRRSKAILIAHLFGSRMPLNAVLNEARRLGLLLFEDCAQAFDGSYRGHPNADVSMFSFGPIKTHTALGGALLTVRDLALLQSLRARQATYIRRSNVSYLGRLLMFAGLKALSRPRLLGPLAALARWQGLDFDELISRRVRGFARGELMPQLRRQPSLGQLRLLQRRLTSSSRAWIERRYTLARAIAAQLERPVVGTAAEDNSHWVLPVICDEPDRLQQRLIAAGFDATRKASSLVAVPAPANHPEWDPVRTRHWLKRLVYLPLHPALKTRDIERLTDIVNECAGTFAPPPKLIADCDRVPGKAEFTPAKSR